jgi:hypothetical protein
LHRFQLLGNFRVGLPWFNRTVRPLRSDRLDDLFRPLVLSIDLFGGNMSRIFFGRDIFLRHSEEVSVDLFTFTV